MSLRDTIRRSIDEAKERKHTHKEVGFRMQPHNDDQCSTCKAFINQHPPHCKKVVDPIYPDAWCRDGIDKQTHKPFDPTFKD